MKSKQFVRLALISMVFLVLFSGMWYYSSSAGSVFSIDTPSQIVLHNNTSRANIPLGSPAILQIVSYGNGGKIFYYDGLMINSSIGPITENYTVYINSTSNSQKLEFHNLTYGDFGSTALSLSPGYYNITPVLSFVVRIETNMTLANLIPKVMANISGKFITTVSRPGSTFYVIPFEASVVAVAAFTSISIIEFRKFSRTPV
ncbi:MAG: hypothetical protein B2I17_04520 [Thermoplasmatales archaeon B_DKE]|nr:MAG: hypothetical protein B2I17_04520 [Thermoplasmatales archaeon B_DKE]QRF75732.1 hypothetical protein Thermo_01238 [Thermoplasmatales archaeon]